MQAAMQDTYPDPHGQGGSSDRQAAARDHMLRFDLEGRGITDSTVLQTMAEIPRERFVTGPYEAYAYADQPLPIGLGQTISQPYIVAFMTQALKVGPDCEVLEIGTGSGYQTAVLARLAGKVFTVERMEPLSLSARHLLSDLGIGNVEFAVGDGTRGWPVARQFDRVMVTAAVQEVPGPILDQLKTGGILLAPVGSPSYQNLVLCQKTKTGVVQNELCGVRFVKLVGEYGFAD
jgi:protein-L-isoaspartate(D-aspartate) O-methyltransferase